MGKYSQEVITKLREYLAHGIPENDTIARVAEDCSIDLTKLELKGSAENRWRILLNYAEKQTSDKVTELVTRACEHDPGNRYLQDAMQLLKQPGGEHQETEQNQIILTAVKKICLLCGQKGLKTEIEKLFSGRKNGVYICILFGESIGLLTALEENIHTCLFSHASTSTTPIPNWFVDIKPDDNACITQLNDRLEKDKDRQAISERLAQVSMGVLYDDFNFHRASPTETISKTMRFAQQLASVIPSSSLWLLCVKIHDYTPSLWFRHCCWCSGSHNEACPPRPPLRSFFTYHRWRTNIKKLEKMERFCDRVVTWTAYSSIEFEQVKSRIHDTLRPSLDQITNRSLSDREIEQLYTEVDKFYGTQKKICRISLTARLEKAIKKFLIAKGFNLSNGDL